MWSHWKEQGLQDEEEPGTWDEEAGGGRNSPGGHDRFQEPDLKNRASWVTTEGQADRWNPTQKEGGRSPPFIPAHFFIDTGSPRIPRQSWSSWPTWPPSREGKLNPTSAKATDGSHAAFVTLFRKSTDKSITVRLCSPTDGSVDGHTASPNPPYPCSASE